MCDNPGTVARRQSHYTAAFRRCACCASHHFSSKVVMASSPQNVPPAGSRTRVDLAEKGWMAVVAGLFLLVVMPGFAQGEMASWMRPTMRAAGAVALLVGIGLLIAGVVRSRWRRRGESDGQSISQGDSALPFAHIPPRFSEPPRATATAKEVGRRERKATSPKAANVSENASHPETRAAEASDWSDTEFLQPAWADTQVLRQSWADTEVMGQDRAAATPGAAPAPASPGPLIAPAAPAAPVTPGAASPQAAPEPLEPNAVKSWSPDVFPLLDQQGFTAAVRAMFAQAGFTSEIGASDATAGVDLRLRSRSTAGASLARCKHQIRKPIGESALREFRASLTAEGFSSGTFATSALFTSEAVRFARTNDIALLDSGALLRQIAKRTPEQQSVLLSLALDPTASRSAARRAL